MKHFIKHAHSSMSRYSLYLFLFIFLFSLVACQDDDERAIKNPGILSLVLASDTTFGNSVITTKTSIAEDFMGFTNPNEYAVEILQGEDVVLFYARFGDMPDEIELAAGSYTMRAYRGNNYPGRFSNPYFEGKTDFKIEKGMRTPIRDTATLANTRVFVNYTDDFIDAYEEFRVRMNTEYMQTDTLNFREDETRAGYFRSDAEGTELILSLWLVKREDTIINYYKPEPLTIFPRENIRLLFKTDGEALNGIGLEVTINKGLDGDETLNMKIPEYAWGDVKEPTVSSVYFKDIPEAGDDQPTYFALQNRDYVRYLDYVIPGSVGKCILNISKSVNGGAATITEYDLANANDASAARALGITLGDQSNSKTYTIATETKEGRIHFTEALAKLPASTDEVEYIYSVYILDALPTNPNSTDTVQMVVAPKGVGPSTLIGTGISDYTILATEVLPDDIVIKYDTDAGIQSSTLTIKRNGNVVGTPFNILSDALPTGISYSDGELKLASNFVRNLEVQPLTDEEYTFTIDAVDNLGRKFVNSSMNFSIILQHVFEIVIPDGNIWAWRTKAEGKISGLTQANKDNLKFYLNGEEYPYDWDGDMTVSKWFTNLLPNTSYSLEIKFNNASRTDSFTTESEIAVQDGDMNTWWMIRKSGSFGLFGAGGSTNIPFLYLNDSASDGLWTTSNSRTAGTAYNSNSYGNTKNNVAALCFPSVVFESRDDANKLAAVIRSTDASSGNGKARGSLEYKTTISSRPSSLSFEYAYSKVGDDNFIIQVLVYTGDNYDESNLIGKGLLESGSEVGNYQIGKVPIIYNVENKKATNILISFFSSNSDNFTTQSGTVSFEVADSSASGAIPYPTTGSCSYTVSHGSTLKVDNVTLNYSQE